MKTGKVTVRREALAQDPLTPEEILTGFYRPARERPGSVAERRTGAPERNGALQERNGHVAERPLPEIDPGHLPQSAQLPELVPAGKGEKKPKPSHYKIVCISLYTEDIERLEGLVRELKRRGHTKANKSQLIRAALEQIDLDKVPKAH